MANMSYCQYQNTSLDMLQCYKTLEEAYENADTLREYLATLSKDEQYGIGRMYSLCKEFVRIMDEMDR